MFKDTMPLWIFRDTTLLWIFSLFGLKFLCGRGARRIIYKAPPPLRLRGANFTPPPYL